MAEQGEQPAFLDPAQLMEAGRVAAQQAAEQPPTETPEPPPDSELYTSARSARWALIWPTEPLTPVEYEELLQKSLRMRAQLGEAEGPQTCERLDALIDAEMSRQIAILQSLVVAEEPAQPEEPVQPQEPKQPIPQEDS